MFIKEVHLKENVSSDEYPYNISAIKNLESLKFDKPVTFFTGENGSGKSTLIEAIAINMGINPEGGSQNFAFHTRDTHSNLYKDILIDKGFERPSTKYFLRAESFYNVASEVDRMLEEDGNISAFLAHGGVSLHESSHGESFFQLIKNRFYERGLYILDEPEAALSPQRQLSLLIIIDDLVKKGAQFIIATHSPIILSYPNSEIYQFDNTIKMVDYKDSEVYKMYKLFIDNPEMMVQRLLKEDN